MINMDSLVTNGEFECLVHVGIGLWWVDFLAGDECHTTAVNNWQWLPSRRLISRRSSEGYMAKIKSAEPSETRHYGDGYRHD